MASGMRPLSNQASRLAAAINDAVETLVGAEMCGSTVTRSCVHRRDSSGNGSVAKTSSAA